MTYAHHLLWVGKDVRGKRVWTSSFRGAVQTTMFFQGPTIEEVNGPNGVVVGGTRIPPTYAFIAQVSLSSGCVLTVRGSALSLREATDRAAKIWTNLLESASSLGEGIPQLKEM